MTYPEQEIKRLECGLLAGLESCKTTFGDQDATDLSALLDYVKALQPKPIEDCPKQLAGPAILFSAAEYIMPSISQNQDNDGKWWNGDWDYEVDATHFIPLSVLQTPKDKS